MKCEDYPMSKQYTKMCSKAVKGLTCLLWFSQVTLHSNAEVRQHLLLGGETKSPFSSVNRNEKSRSHALEKRGLKEGKKEF